MEVAPNGAPILESGALFVSLSHSGNGALAALATAPVGCDLEAPPRRSRYALALAARFFHPDELEDLLQTPQADRESRFLRLWTRKEAVFKSGAMDWSQSLAHPWRDGENTIGSGRLLLSNPVGLPVGWVGTIAARIS
jgi:hypothetical protein